MSLATGSGTRQRSVKCVRTDGAQTVVASALCIEAKPALVEVCADSSGCSYNLVDECVTGTHDCSSHALCQDTYSSYTCKCLPGFVGSGKMCADIDECRQGSVICGPQALCFNTLGAYQCQCHVGLYLAPSGVCTTCPHGFSSSAPGAVSAAECTSCAPGFYGKPTIVGGSGCISCPHGATSPLGSLTSASCYCGFGYVQAPGSSTVSCILSFSDSSSLSKFVDLGNPGESCNQVCARTGRQCNSNLTDGVRSVSDISKALSALDVALVSAFNPAGSLSDVFTGLHAHYKAENWDKEAGIWQDVSGNARHGVLFDSTWYFAAGHFVYKGREYRTLHGTPRGSASVAPSNCYSNNWYLPLPPGGWEIAPDGEDSRHVIAAYVWGEYCLYMSGGKPEPTALGRSQGINCPHHWWSIPQSGDKYNMRCEYYHSANTPGYISGGILLSRLRIDRKFRVNLTAAAGHGASARIKAVSGGADDQIAFPDNSIPPTFTVCSVSRLTDPGHFGTVIASAATLPRSLLDPSSGARSWAHGHAHMTTTWVNGSELVVLFKGRQYRTLDGTPPTQSSVGCQLTSLPMPAGGWELAPNNEDSQSVIASYGWGADCVLTGGWGSRLTAAIRGPTACASPELIIEWSSYSYKPRYCNSRILISRLSTVSPQSGATSYADTVNMTANGPRADDWVVVCGTSRAGAPVLVDGVVRSRTVDWTAGGVQWTAGGLQMTVGGDAPWSVAEIAIWSRALTLEEMHAVSNYYLVYLARGDPARLDPLPLSSARFCTNGHAASSDGDAPYISASGRCYHRALEANVDCAVSYSGKTRVCICSLPCREGYYGMSTQCRRCPPRSWSEAGQSFITSCSCEAGLYLVTNLSIPYGGSGYCQQCPLNMHSPPGSTQLSECSCNADFYLAADGSFECVACPGNMKSPAGSTDVSACKCPASFYADAGHNKTCRPCPGSSSSAEGSTSINNCICPPGLGVATNSYSRHMTSDQDVCDVEIRSSPCHSRPPTPGELGCISFSILTCYS